METIEKHRERMLRVITLTGLKQGEFAKAIGVSPGNISHIVSEKGRQSPITEEIADKVISAFPNMGFTKHWLVFGEERKVEEKSADLFSDSAPATAVAKTLPPTTDISQNGAQSNAFLANNVTQNSISFGSSPYSGITQNQPSRTDTRTEAQAEIRSDYNSSSDNNGRSYTAFEHSLPPEEAAAVKNGRSVAEADKKASAKRTLVRVMMFYSDGSFVEYRPDEMNGK